MKEGNVAFIIHTLSNGGAERIMSYLTQNYSTAENKYLIVYHRSEVEYDFSGELISLDIAPSNNVFGKILNYLKRIYKLRRLKDELNIKKSISMLDSPNIINILSKRKDKVIISLRNHKSKEYSGLKKLIYRKIIKFLYNKADKIIAISKGVADDLIENFKLDKTKINIIYNPVDKIKIQSLMHEKIIEEHILNEFKKNKIVINSGRLSYQKGQWHLIKVFKKIAENNNGVKLAILGKGELEQELKELVKSLGLSEKVIFLGYQENPFKYIYKSDIFVLSSLYEGFGNVIVESMACRVPVISTDCKSGPKEILSSENLRNYDEDKINYLDYGVLVPCFKDEKINYDSELSNEEEYLYKAIIDMLDDSNKIEYYKINGEKRLDDFSLIKIVSKWEEL
ncbi:N-acetylgalactosamine-N,N'-diacetylbacillosaminyl-diphospho-undecaprenol 4-alpha-N-acetylgalactosaminyltransferase [bioreactor metagenome]|uniref:N-acetylgalactosamine-N, N'-diacetylbacillosaminyl-diphospho-undecaprenol 4-alpha-N-acetylgalactosaminyltransferase n=1 Tax=bioreactor metagenome TaxID=1076179 RepID=A0A644YRY0_9ZZZZ